MKKRRGQIAIIVIALLVVGAGVVIVQSRFWQNYQTGIMNKLTVLQNKEEEKNKSTAPFIYFSKLDGTGVTSSEAVEPPVVGVMIDNHPEAQPSAGLSTARVVYEAPAEGGLTRYLAFFTVNQSPTKVGPVRSARPYFINFSREFGDTLYMHSGGSPAGLALLKQNIVFDANEFSRGSYYWRSRDRYAPHNLYTSGEKWQQLVKDYGSQRPVRHWEGWKFENNNYWPNLNPAGGANDSASSTSSVEVTITFSPTYIVTWRYVTSTESRTSPDAVRHDFDKSHDFAKSFSRYINNRLVTEQGVEGGLTADTVIIQKVPVTVLDEVGRKAIAIVGQGPMTLFKHGIAIDGTWKKSSLTGRTRWYDESGQEVAVAPGKIWVEVVPKGSKVEVR